MSGIVNSKRAARALLKSERLRILAQTGDQGTKMETDRPLRGWTLIIERKTHKSVTSVGVKVFRHCHWKDTILMHRLAESVEVFVRSCFLSGIVSSVHS